MDGWMDKWMDGWTIGQTKLFIELLMNGQTDLLNIDYFIN
jgi:hypothetical protein